MLCDAIFGLVWVYYASYRALYDSLINIYIERAVINALQRGFSRSTVQISYKCVLDKPIYNSFELWHIDISGTNWYTDHYTNEEHILWNVGHATYSLFTYSTMALSCSHYPSKTTPMSFIFNTNKNICISHTDYAHIPYLRGSLCTICC